MYGGNFAYARPENSRIGILCYDSHELLSLVYDLRCDHNNYNVMYAVWRIIYGRQTRLGFVIMNFFHPNISIRRIINRILYLRQPVR